MTWCSLSRRSITGARRPSRSRRYGNTLVSSIVWCVVTTRQYDSQYAPSVQLFCRIVIVLISERARPTSRRAGRDLVDELVQLPELAAQVVVHVDEVLRAGLLLRRVEAVGVRGRVAGRVLSSHGCVGLRRVPSSGVGADGERPRRCIGTAGPAARASPWRGPIRSPRGGVDELAHRRGDVLAEVADRVRIVGAQDERAHAVGEGELGQLLGPVAGRPDQAGPVRGRRRD